jgi:RNA polymerase sigma-70 factor, ECF subfamily
VALRRPPSVQYRVMTRAPNEELSDETLLARARHDRQAFEQFYRRHFDAIVRFAARRSNDQSMVVDLVAAVWLEVVASLDRFDPRQGRALPWILGIAANLCASERRRRGRERQALRRLAGRRVLEDDDYARLDREIDAARTAAALRGALSGLPPGERVVAELVLVDGLTPSEVASALGIPAASVRMRLTRARRKLRAKVEGGAGTRVEASEEVPS